MAPHALYSEQTRAYHRYLGWLEEISRLQAIAGLVPDDQPLLLQQIYVPLRLSAEPLRDDAEDSTLQGNTFSLAELLAQRAAYPPDSTTEPWLLLVSGPAGSGKTTLTHSVSLSLTGLVRDDLQARFEQHIPIPILLRNVPKEHLGLLDAMVEWWLKQVSREGFEAEDLYFFLDEGLAIIILDGLDELGSVEARARVLEALRGHRWVTGGSPDKRLAGRPCLVMVTGRPSAFEGLGLSRASRKAHVAPFTMVQVRSFLHRWFELRPISEKLRQDSVERFMQRLEGEQRLKALRILARRPAYLTALAYVHGTRGALPHSRVQLYEMIVDAYIDQLDRVNRVRLEALQWDRVDKRSVLAAIAWNAHSGRASEASAGTGDRSFAFTLEELVALTARAIVDLTPRTIEPDAAAELVRFYLAGTGLLSETWEGSWEFGHLSFQEYLAALHVVELATAEGDKVGVFDRKLFDRLDRAGWLEVAVQAMAIDALRSGGRGHPVLLARLSPDKAGHLALLGHLLGGAEIPLRLEERACWLWLWALHGARRGDFPGQKDVVAFEPNREALLSLGRLVLVGWTRDGRAASSLYASLSKQIAAVARQSVEHWSWKEDLLDLKREARLLVPLATTEWFEALHEALDAFLAATRWHDLQEPSGLDMREAKISWHLCQFLIRTSDSIALLYRQSPLQWVLSSKDLTSLATLRTVVPSTLPRRRWLELLDLCAMVACARVMVMAAPYTESLVRPEANVDKILAIIQVEMDLDLDLDLDLDRVLARDGDLARDRVGVLVRALELDRDRDRDLNRALELAQIRVQVWSQDLALELARNGALELARVLAKVRKLGRNRVRELASARDRIWVRTQDLARELARDRAQTPWHQSLLAVDGLSKSSDERVLAILHLLQAAALARLNPTAFPARYHRSDLSALRDRMLRGDVLEGVTDPEQREDLLLEWRDFLASAQSPIPLIDALQSTEWDFVDLTAEGFLRLTQTLLGKAPDTSTPPTASS